MEEKWFGAMLDMSRNAVMKPSEVKNFAKILKSFGYNMIQLYTEDTYEVDGEPYFGYMRGRYTKEELADIVAYCESIGVEVIPCIQTLAHLNQIFRSGEYAGIRDTEDILLVGDGRTYALIENMFKTVKQVFRSEYIHIGMDEAHMLGLGRYLDRHGYRDRFDILSEHLAKVIEIAKKYDLKPIMWSDMFFRLANHGAYYSDGDVITDRIVSKCPDGVELVYWDYYHEDRESYDRMIAQHKKFGRPTWFAGGAWSWTGFAPLDRWSLDTMTPAMKACAENGVENVLITMWGDNGKECSFYSLLPVLFKLRRIYDGITDEEEIKKQFRETTGEDYDRMLSLELPNRVSPDDLRRSNVSKVMLYNDPLTGIFDSAVDPGAPADYRAHAVTLRENAKGSGYAYLFECEAALCDLLAVKYDLGARARVAYQNGDKAALGAIVKDFERTSELLEAFYRKFKALWMKENKPFGFEIQDIRLGGLKQRLITAREKIAAYAAGEIGAIEEYDAELLDYIRPGTGGKMPQYNNYAAIASASVL